jgi:hypothetical protein
MWEGLTNKMGQKNKKNKKWFPECRICSTRGRGPSPSAMDKVLGEEVPSPSATNTALRKIFFLLFFAPIFFEAFLQPHLFLPTKPLMLPGRLLRQAIGGKV